RAGQGFGGDGHISLLMQHHAGERGRVSFCQLQANLGEALTESRNDPWQKIPRLRMRAADGQAALVFPRELIADALEIVDLAHDAFDDLGDRMARFGQPLDALAVAFEDLDAQLFLELDDRLRYAGLRGVQAARRFGQIEVAAYGFANEAELLKVHQEPR